MTRKIERFIQHIKDIPHLWEEIEILFVKIDKLEARINRIEDFMDMWSKYNEKF